MPYLAQRAAFSVFGRPRSGGAGTAVAEKLAALMTEELLEKRARGGSKQKFQKVLRKVRSAPPAEEDRL